jgi:2-polyprenyl-6-hydroxyphenyl methylase/3-demethylubiquinone-9 3-methyltransferase
MLSLDMGCGTGVFSFYLAAKGGPVVGVDGSAEMLRFCEERRAQCALDNLRFQQSVLPDIDESGLAQAGLVISSSVVEYVEDLESTYRLFARLLAPGGTLILSMPTLFSLSRLYDRARYRMRGEPEVYRYIRHFTTPALLRAELRPHGFTAGEVHYYAHETRLAQLSRRLRLPAALTEELFVAVFHKPLERQA